MDLDENLLATFGLISSSVIAIVANSLLLLVFCRRRGLRTISNRFVINLLFANVISSLFLLPMLAIDSSFLGATANPTVTSGAQQLHSHSHLNINITTTEYIQSSINNNSTSQSQQYQKLPLQQFKELPLQQYKDLSLQQFKELPLQQYKDLSLQQFKELPLQQYKDLPLQHFKELPLQQYKDLPLQQYQELSSQQYQELSSKQYKGLPLQQYQELPSQQYHQELPSQQYHQELPLQQSHQELSSQQYHQESPLQQYHQELPSQQYHQELPSQQHQESPLQQHQESPLQQHQESPLQHYQESTSQHYQESPSLLANSAQLIITEEETEEILTNNGETVIESAEEILVDSVGDNLEIIQTNVNYSVLYGNTVNNSYQRALVCFLAEFGVTFVCTACILSVLLIGMDQYFAVLHPLRYQSYINKTRSVLLVSLSWFSSVLFGVGGTFSNANIHYFKTCQTLVPSVVVVSTTRSITVAFSIFYVTVAILVPFLALCVIYVYIYSAAHKNSARVRKSTSINFNQTPQGGATASGMQKTYSAPDFQKINEARNALLLRTNSERVCKTILDNLKCKLSNASVFRYREENRTAKISLLVIFMVLTCYVPYGVSLVINSLSPVTKSSSTLSRFNAMSLVLLVSSNVVSPFLFAYRNRRIQRELGKFFKLVPRHRSVRSRPIVREIITTTNTQENNETVEGNRTVTEPFLATVNECGDGTNSGAAPPPPSIVECKIESETVTKKSILKRVCSSKNWNNYKKCTFITVPDSCLDARGSFSSASTQISMED